MEFSYSNKLIELGRVYDNDLYKEGDFELELRDIGPHGSVDGDKRRNYYSRVLILAGFGAWTFIWGCMNLVHWL